MSQWNMHTSSEAVAALFGWKIGQDYGLEKDRTAWANFLKIARDEYIRGNLNYSIGWFSQDAPKQRSVREAVTSRLRNELDIGKQLDSMAEETLTWALDWRLSRLARTPAVVGQARAQSQGPSTIQGQTALAPQSPSANASSHDQPQHSDSQSQDPMSIQAVLDNEA